MLESCRVGGVAGDGDADVLLLHDGNAFRNVVCAVAADVCAGSLGIRNALDFGDFFGVGIELGLNICEAVDPGDDPGSILSESVEDDLQGVLADLVGVQGDLDGAFRRREGLVSSEEAEAAGLLGEEQAAAGN